MSAESFAYLIVLNATAPPPALQRQPARPAPKVVARPAPKTVASPVPRPRPEIARSVRGVDFSHLAGAVFIPPAAPRHVDPQALWDRVIAKADPRVDPQAQALWDRALAKGRPADPRVDPQAQALWAKARRAAR